jgi:hypothetical protein
MIKRERIGNTIKLTVPKGSNADLRNYTANGRWRCTSESPWPSREAAPYGVDHVEIGEGDTSCPACGANWGPS